jgi:uncharacterized protein (TIGR03382 family)
MKMNRLFLSVGVLGLLAGATSASAEVIASVTYDDLAGNFVSTGPGMGMFTARAVNTAQLQSTMTASRLVPVQSDAEFASGFVSAADPADIVISIATNTGTLAGNGSFVVTDVDGDTITGNISGSWANLGIFLAFNGALSNVQFNGGTFNGNLGSFSTLFAGGPPFDGAIVQLTTASGGFGGINNSTTGGTLQIVPSPGALALLGLGGLAAARRRR